MNRFYLLFFGILLSHFQTTAQTSSSLQSLDAQLSELKWRSIGPYRGGRANAIAGVIGDNRTYYAGYTGGGVWKTTDAGVNWKNLSDGYFTVGSIGAIAVSESDANVVVVGTGEHAVRGVMTSYGNGVYKSTDAGKSWNHLGLEGTRHIANVIIHPTNYDVIYVAAQGAVHGPSEERGVYKSLDGGKSWHNKLFIDIHTGISSLVMDPTNPRILYAATWQHQRYPWKVESGGPGCAIYKSTDEGETWRKLTTGLPDIMGKIGLSVSASDPNRVFAIVEAQKKEAGLYRSDDGGETWKLFSSNQLITARSWYYMEVFADPNNRDVVYVLNAPLMRSIDGGKTFESMRVIHGDCHDFWINPHDGKNIAMAEDGGATISFDRGDVWSSLNNQPTAQFYRISADKQKPYWLYSGQQDNVSVAIPSRTNTYGILTRHWYNGPGCESAMVTFDDLENPRVLYGGCFNGRISLLDNKTMESKDIMVYPMTNLGYEPKDMKYRFNWNAPLINSPHNSSVMYYASNVLFKTDNGGYTWSPVSPDLTKNDTTRQGPGGGPITNEGAGGENYNTIYYIAESPHEEGVIYTGSDCGLIQLTRNGGETCENITPNNLPETMIHAIEVSPHDPATVYFASTRYKFNDLKNYSYKSTNYGKTWQKIGDDINKDDFFKVIREDQEVPGLLYAGGERAFYVSFDGGDNFQQFQSNFPSVPITDLIIRDNDLAASTAGRGFWVLDDLSPLQQFGQADQSAAPKLIAPKATDRFLINSSFYLITEHGFGENPREGVTFDYFLDADSDSLLTLEILDELGNVVRTITDAEEFVAKPSGTRGNIPAINTEHLPAKTGHNRFTWDFRSKGLIKIPERFILGADYRGHRVAPGRYAARLRRAGTVSEVDFEILAPPDMDIPDQAWELQQNMLNQIEGRINEMHEAVLATMQMNKKLEQIGDQLKDDDDLGSLREEVDQLNQEIKAWQQVVIELRQKGFQDALNWHAGINAEYFLLRGNLDTNDPQIPDSYRERLQDLEQQWADHREKFDELVETKIPAFNAAFAKENLPVLEVPAKRVGKP